MKRLAQLTLFLAAAATLSAAEGTFTGEIMDKQCAEMGSHDAMMKSENAKNAKECALACAKQGGGFALLDTQSKKVYAIADANKVREYAGERVQITGDYDQNADVLHVKSVTRAQ
jgi:hypothetical protein